MEPADEPTTLAYESTSRARRDSAWAVVGFSLALLAACIPGYMAWDLWRSRQAGAASASIGFTPVYFVLLAAVAAACARGLTVGRKRFAIAGLLVVLASAAGAIVLQLGSPW